MTLSGCVLLAARPKQRRSPATVAALNDAQLKAVKADAGAQLIVAAAGTGKTKTLVERMVWLHCEFQVAPEKMVLLTFTKRAAREMISRAEKLIGAEGKIRGGTFHSFSMWILHKYGCPNFEDGQFNVLDGADSVEMLRRIRSDLSLAADGFPRATVLLKLMSKSANSQVPLQEVIRDHQLLEWQEGILQIHEEYQRKKQSSKVMDYDDLLLNVCALLEQKRRRQKVAVAIQHLLVDEYQDTNPLQARLTRLLCSVHRNITVVGDDAQSIYSFRGATVENILRFPQEFPGCLTSYLQDNYRSTQQILDLANAVIASTSAATLYPKQLRSALQLHGSLPALIFTSGEMAQAQEVIERMQALLNDGMKPSDIAVLYRNSQNANLLEILLTRHQMGYRKFGGRLFQESPHVKDLLALLRLAANPRDESAWTRTLTAIPLIGEKRSKKLYGDALASDPPQLDLDPWQKSPFHDELKKLQDLLKEVKQMEEGGMPARELVEEVIDWYKPRMSTRFEREPEGKEKRDLDLATIAEVSADATSLMDVLSDLVLEIPDKDNQEEQEGTITLSTIHSAKGLEWKAVFLLNMTESRGERNERDEELRVLYVAITRAKEYLTLMCPDEFKLTSLLDEVDLHELFQISDLGQGGTE